MARKQRIAQPAQREEEATPMKFIGTHIRRDLLSKIDAVAQSEKRKRAAMHRILLEEAINARAQTLSI
jgi:hypothetical protein